MSDLLSLLRRKSSTVHRGALANDSEPYRPLIAVWLLEMALCLGWYRRRSPRRPPDVMTDDYFVHCTGVKVPTKRAADADSDDDDDDDARRWGRVSDAAVTAAFRRALAAARRQPVARDLPLFRNVELFARLVGLDDVEKAVLVFFVAMNAFPEFQETISDRNVTLTRHGIARLLAVLLGQPEMAIAAALDADGTLASARILWFNPVNQRLETRASLMSGLDTALLSPNADESELANRFLRRASAPELACADFPHLARDTETLVEYLGGVLRDGVPGSNVLLYGPPGTGKTELAKAVATILGVDLFEVAYCDADGNSLKGTRRLAEFNLCQRILARQRNALVMFDEIEDVFASRGFPWFLLGEEDEGPGSGGKAWINRTLERNPTPAIWITNDPNIDPAYLRRFDYSIRFPVPPQAVRLAIARRHLGEFDPPAGWLERIAANEQTTPAQLEAAAKVARLAASGDGARARQLVEQTLERSAVLLDQKRTPTRSVCRTRFDLRFVNTDVDVDRVVRRLKIRHAGTFCFYGPAGTGKSELARHLADEIGKPILVRRASDILSRWVGGTERNIARMFAAAREENAVLVLDEADSFLADRRSAHRGWEVTQVDELLTQMEAFEGVFVCTTNLMDKLDPASLRRFAFKVRFDYLNPDQRWAMFHQEFVRLGGDPNAAAGWEARVRRLERLTPGDFAVVARQFELWGTAPSAGEVYELLRKECEAKGGGLATIGFAA